MGRLTLIFVEKCQRPRHPKQTRERTKLADSRLPIANIPQSSAFKQADGEHWKRTESAEIALTFTGRWFSTRIPRILVQKEGPCQLWCWDNWMQKMKVDSYLTLQTKISSKWIQDLNLRVKTIKLLDENIDRSLCDFELVKVPDTKIKNIKK